MADEPAAITAEEFAEWLTPSQAPKLLEHLRIQTARDIILDRLKYGHIKSAARRYNYQNESGEFFPLSRTIWNNAEVAIAGSAFWAIGDLTVQIRVRSNAYGYQDFPLALFGIRLDPVGLQELLTDATREIALPNPSTHQTPKLIEPTAHPVLASIVEEPPESLKGPPVPDALLRDWYALYQRAYSGASDTEALALRSAQGMFPNKSVSRRRVRALRGDQPRGRKPHQPNG